MKNNCLLILGMHRSGTSAVSGLIKEGNDLHFGNNLLGATQHNKKGHFESKNVINLNDMILHEMDLSWDTSVNPMSLIDNKQSKRFISKIKNLLKKEYLPEGTFAIKDPRLCILLPLWIEALTSLKVDTKALIVYRTPLEIAESLKNRNSFSQAKSLDIWANYIKQAEFNTRSIPREIVDYNAIIEGDKELLENIERFLNKEGIITKELKSNFLEKKLKHSAFQESELFTQLPGPYYYLHKCYINKVAEGVLNKAYQEINKFNQGHPSSLDTSIFMDLGKGFNADDIMSVACIKDESELFKLNAVFNKSLNIKKLRWDPYETDCILYFKSIWIQYYNGKKEYLDLNKLSSNGELIGPETYYFDISDPQFYFTNTKGIKSLEVIFDIMYLKNLLDNRVFNRLSGNIKVSTLSTQLGHVQNTFQNQAELLNKELQELNHRAEIKDKELQELNNSVEVKDKELFDLSNQVKSKDEEINKLQHNLQISESKINDLVNQINTEINKFSEEKKNITQKHEKWIHEKEQQINKYAELLTISNASLKKKESEIKRLNENSYHDIARIGDLKLRNVELTHHIQNLDEIILHHKDTIQKMRLKNRIKRLLFFWRR